MSIDLHCDGCGKRLRAPREAAGHRSTCPACGRGIYIPTPDEDLEELPLAPEDPAELQREQALQEERRRLDHALAREKEGLPNEAAGRRATGPGRDPAANVEAHVLDYLVALRNSDLDRANEALTVLRRHRTEARRALERLTADQIPPAALANVPPAVYQGFLKRLIAQL